MRSPRELGIELDCQYRSSGTESLAAIGERYVRASRLELIVALAEEFAARATGTADPSEGIAWAKAATAVASYGKANV